MSEFTHHDAHRLIQTALDEDLPPRDQADLTAHLGHCPDCRLYADELRHLQVTLRQVAERHRHQARLVPDLSDRVRRKLNDGQARQWWRSLGSGLAQTGSLMVLALLVLRMGHLSPPASVQPAAELAAPAAPVAVSLPATNYRSHWLLEADLPETASALVVMPLDRGPAYGPDIVVPDVGLRPAVPR